MFNPMGNTNPQDLGNGGTLDGDVTITGDLTVSGGIALTLSEVLQGTSTIDVNSTEALLVRKDGAGGDIFTVDTTNSTVEIGGHLVLPDASGSAGVIKLGGSSDIQIYHDGSHSYLDHLTGSLKIRSLAHGGDIIFHTEASDGTQNTTALTIDSDGNSTFAGIVKVDQNASTGEHALHIDSESTNYHNIFIEGPATTTAAVIRIDGASALTTGHLFNANITSTAMATTATDGAFRIDHTGNTTSNVNNLMYLHNNHASSTGTTVLKLVQDANAPALYIDNQGNQASIAVSSDDNVFISMDTTQSNGDEWQIMNAVGGTTSNLQFKNIDQSKVVMLMEEDGKIGISNTDPDYKLDVSGDMRVEQTADATIATFIGSDGNNATIEIHADDGDDNADKWRMTANTAGALAVGSYSTGSWVNHLKLDANSRFSMSNNDAGTGGEDSTSGNTIFGYLAGAAIDSDVKNNTLFGHKAGTAINGGDWNVIVGEGAGKAVTDGHENVFLGQNAGAATTSVGFAIGIGQAAMGAGNVTSAADGSVAIGASSLAALTSGAANTAIGYQSMLTHTTGGKNVAIGHQVMFDTNAGSTSLGSSENVFIGYQVASGTWTDAACNHNVGIGNDVMRGALDGANYNVALGSEALMSVTTGDANIVAGYQAGNDITTGEANICIGNRAGDEFDTENYNIFIGEDAGGGAINGADKCVAIGKSALDGAITHDGTVAIGHDALTSVTSGINLAVGFESGKTITTGTQNTLLGYQAGNDIDEGGRNTAVGHLAFGGALDANGDESFDNTFIGFGSGSGNWVTAVSNKNTAVGSYSMDGAMNGALENTALGYDALTNLTTGDGNVALGYKALEDVAGGSSNVAIGNASGIALTSGSDNIAIGTNCLYNSTDVDKAVIIGKNAGNGALDSGADGVIGIGFEALTACTSGTGNIAIGYEAGKAITTGEFSTVIGYQALKTATVTAGQDEHTAVGYQALKDCNGDRNTAVGAGAMSGVDNSDNCVAVGAYALQSGGTSDDGIDGTVAIGDSSLNSLTTGSGTTAVGKATGLYLTTGDYNTAIGFEALYTEDAGGGNTAVGYRALKVCNNDTGGNTAVGKDGLVAVTSGNNNTAVGLGAGSNLETGTNNVFIGRNSQANGTGGTNQVVIGGIDTEGNGDNTVTLGNQDATGVYAGEEGGAVVYTAGVNFPDSQAASGDVNTLDDYEEGNFTVTVSGDSSGAFSAEEGEYVKIGKVVHFRIVINVSSNFAANTIAGLPFACTQNALSSLVGGIAVMTSNANDEPITASVTTGGSTLSFYSGSDATDTHLPNTTNDVYRLEGTYFAA